MVSDFLVAENQIIERLRARLPDLHGVHPWSEIEGVLEDSGRRLPAAFVVFGGHRIDDRTGSVSARYAQTWHAILAVPSRNDADGVRARTAAGPWLHDIAAALQDFKPVVGLGRMVATDPPRVVYEPGYALFPLTFTLALSISATDE
jgi:hypothetical protein